MEEQIFFKNLLWLGKKPDYFNKLNEGLCYIFDRTIGFLQNGSFLEINDHQPQDHNDPELDYLKLPSGFLNCSKILTQILLNYKFKDAVLLIDEPELHLEPRACRRLINFIFYLHFKKEPEWEAQNIYYPIKERVEKKRKLFPEKYINKIFPGNDNSFDWVLNSTLTH